MGFSFTSSSPASCRDAAPLAVGVVALGQVLPLGEATPTELENPTQVTHLSGSRPIWDARLSPDGSVLAGTHANGVFLQRIDGAEAVTLWQHPFSFACVDWTPDGHSLVVSGTGYGTDAHSGR